MSFVKVSIRLPMFDITGLIMMGWDVCPNVRFILEIIVGGAFGMQNLVID